MGFDAYLMWKVGQSKKRLRKLPTGRTLYDIGAGYAGHLKGSYGLLEFATLKFIDYTNLKLIREPVLKKPPRLDSGYKKYSDMFSRFEFHLTPDQLEARIELIMPLIEQINQRDGVDVTGSLLIGSFRCFVEVYKKHPDSLLFIKKW